jgi:hypothetical protein
MKKYKQSQIDLANNTASYSTIFWNGWLEDPPETPKQALLHFLHNYAYERQGAAQSYRTLANLAINQKFKDEITSITKKDAEKAWKIYNDIAKDKYHEPKLNETHNPMKSDKGVLRRLSQEKAVNLYTYTRDLLSSNQVPAAYKFINSIRGVGDKITCLYLRDIAHRHLETDRHYHPHFQPIDTWVEQALKIILGDKYKAKKHDIIELCRQAGCSPLDFNAGAWVAGNAIARDYGRLQEILNDPEEGKKLIDYRIKEQERRTASMKKWIN